MTNKIMCVWVNNQTCKFSEFHNITNDATFHDDYCTLCLKGKLINEIISMNGILDHVLISMKK